MSSIIPKFHAKISKNWVKFDESVIFQVKKYLIPLEGREVEVIISAPQEHLPRSIQQNKYYRGVILHLLSEHTGYTEEEVHEILKQKFLGHILSFGRQVYTISKSTTELTTVEMTEYMERIRRWAALEFGLSIPEPEEVV